mgnify:FL=1
MGLRKEISRHHAVIFTLVRNPGAPDRRLHVLYLLQPPYPPTPLVSLAEYVIDAGRARSLAWQRHTARAVGLLVDFLIANATRLRTQSNPKVFALFAEALVAGTVSLDGEDPSGLFWEPKSTSRAIHLLGAATSFSDWLANRYGVQPLNPFKEATISDQIAYWRRIDKRKPHTLLGYATYRSDHQARAQAVRSGGIRRKTASAFAREVKQFPSERMQDLLLTGFATRDKKRSPHVHERLSLKDILITILLHGGGLRESEPFHLFVSDVGVDPQNPSSAMVRLYHPEQGAAPTDYIDPISNRRIIGDREEYLRVRWRMEPRTLIEGRFKAGWKDLHLLDQREKYALVHWFEPGWGELFLALVKPYLIHCRSRFSRHPFLFVSQKRGFEGDPYTIDSYRQAHARAVRRIGLVPAKTLGTTPHGHRHAYGRRLVDAKVDELTIQRVMHHKSPASQLVYTDPPASAIAAALADAEMRLSTPEIKPVAFDERWRPVLGAIRA